MQGGDVKRAVDCCVALSQWDQAVALAQQYSIPQVHSLLFKYAAMLLDQQKTMEAVQLYRKVHPPTSTDPATHTFLLPHASFAQHKRICSPMPAHFHLGDHAQPSRQHLIVY